MTGQRRFALGTLATLLAAALWLRYSGATAVLESRATEIGAGTLSASAPVPAVAWKSRDACEAALRGSPSSPVGRARIATWNIRWFPDSQPEVGAPGPSTDLQWLSCALALLRAPVIAVQEFRTHPKAVARTQELLRLLDSRTGGQWRVRLDGCTHDSDSRVGFLYDAARVHASNFETIVELTGSADCRDDLHPGFAGRFAFDAFDATLIAIHASWGFEPQSLQLRRSARARLRGVVARVVESTGDNDVIVLGDFNTNGARQAETVLGAAEEIDELHEAVGDGAPGLRVVPADQRCTQYEPHGAAYLLDHVLVGRDIEELPPLAVAEVGGLCALRRCSGAGVSNTPYYGSLSDHCPVVIELADVDLD